MQGFSFICILPLDTLLQNEHSGSYSQLLLSIEMAAPWVTVDNNVASTRSSLRLEKQNYISNGKPQTNNCVALNATRIGKIYATKNLNHVVRPVLTWCTCKQEWKYWMSTNTMHVGHVLCKQCMMIKFTENTRPKWNWIRRFGNLWLPSFVKWPNCWKSNPIPFRVSVSVNFIMSIPSHSGLYSKQCM